MDVTIIIPWIRRDKIGQAITAAILNAGVDVLIYAKEDKERIGCPLMVKEMVAKVNTEYVCFLGDDTIAAPNFIKNALKEMAMFPGKCGLIGLNDKSGRDIPAHWIAHMDLLAHLGGEFFHTGYTHTFCDNELMERTKQLGRYLYSETATVLHEHPFETGEQPDSDYKRVYAKDVYEADKALFEHRRANEWHTHLRWIFSNQ